MKPWFCWFNEIVYDDVDPPAFPPQRLTAVRLGPFIIWLRPKRDVTFGWSTEEHVEQVS